MKHGTFIGWYNEAKLVEGGYRNGKKEGVWRVWSDDGQLIKEITYRGNKEVTVKEYKLGATD
jgi:antitoxin component YwqK of YwqJK toxin-antitoxin module